MEHIPCLGATGGTILSCVDSHPTSEGADIQRQPLPDDSHDQTGSGWRTHFTWLFFFFKALCIGHKPKESQGTERVA